METIEDFQDTLDTEESKAITWIAGASFWYGVFCGRKSMMDKEEFPDQNGNQLTLNWYMSGGQLGFRLNDHSYQLGHINVHGTSPTEFVLLSREQWPFGLVGWEDALMKTCQKINRMIQAVFPGMVIAKNYHCCESDLDDCRHHTHGGICELVNKKWVCVECLERIEKFRQQELSRTLAAKVVVATNPERSKMKPSLRYQILKRDNFMCKICGRTAEAYSVKLVVDHIVPVAKGGLTIESNLRTLCQECNAGKSDDL